MSGAVASPGERAILRFFEDLVSIGGVATAAGFAAQMNCTHPAAAARTLQLLHVSSVAVSVAEVHCWRQLRQYAVACSCCWLSPAAAVAVVGHLL